MQGDSENGGEEDAVDAVTEAAGVSVRARVATAEGHVEQLLAKLASAKEKAASPSENSAEGMASALSVAVSARSRKLEMSADDEPPWAWAVWAAGGCVLCMVRRRRPQRPGVVGSDEGTLVFSVCLVGPTYTLRQETLAHCCIQCGCMLACATPRSSVRQQCVLTLRR